MADKIEVLKPCPFCGDDAMDKPIEDFLGGFRVVCPHCDMAGPERLSASESLAAWNRRALAQGEPGEAVAAWRFRLATDRGWSNWRTDPDDHERFKRDGYLIEYAYRPTASAPAAEREPISKMERRVLIDHAGDITDGLSQEDFADQLITMVEAMHGIGTKEPAP